MQNIENGSFLISHPTLLEDSFFKAIVLVTHHNFEETIGLVINHPSKIKLHEIIDDIPNSDFPVYIGGPVSKNSIHFIHSLGRLIPKPRSKSKLRSSYTSFFRDILKRELPLRI